MLRASTEEAGKKKARFDEENLQATRRSIGLGEGIRNLTGSSTPYPRHNEAVNASELRKRLNQAIVNECNDNDDDSLVDAIEKITINPVEDVNIDYDLGPDAITGESFVEKRKRFRQAEYIIAKQRVMSAELHQPGPSVVPQDKMSHNSLYPDNYSAAFGKDRKSSPDPHKKKDGPKK